MWEFAGKKLLLLLRILLLFVFDFFSGVANGPAGELQTRGLIHLDNDLVFPCPATTNDHFPISRCMLHSIRSYGHWWIGHATQGLQVQDPSSLYCIGSVRPCKGRPAHR